MIQPVFFSDLSESKDYYLIKCTKQTCKMFLQPFSVQEKNKKYVLQNDTEATLMSIFVLSIACNNYRYSLFLLNFKALCISDD